jgi:hypothetical protein
VGGGSTFFILRGDLVGQDGSLRMTGNRRLGLATFFGEKFFIF